MKIQFLLIPCLAAAMLGGVQQTNAQDTKIGLIDFARIQRQYYRTDLERKKFEEGRAEKRSSVDERKGKMKELIQMQQEAEKQLKDPTLSEDAKKDVLKKAQERTGQITSLQRELVEQEARDNKDLADDANTIQRSLTKEIYDVIGTLAEKQGFSIVFNRTFGINGIPTVAYGNDDIHSDFTDDVIAELNKNAPAGWKPPAEDAE